MLAGEETEPRSADAAPWASLLERHRAKWVESLAGDRPMVWLDHYTATGADAEALHGAVAEGKPVVLGLPADAGGAAAREASRLAAELGGVTVTQQLAAGSRIHLGDEQAGDVVHFLVCVNVEAARATESSSLTDIDTAPVLSGYVRFLEEANRTLSEANARLARENLGVHDSAAAAVVADLEREVQRQRDIAEDASNRLTQALARLDSPRYRAVDKVRAIVFGFPGLSKLFELRSRLIQARRNR
jgi:hypothetical protein